MAIQNKKPKPKASSKTDAMKALMTGPTDAEVTADETAETAVSREMPAIARPPMPAPPVVRTAPALPRPVAWQSLQASALTRRATDDETEEPATEGATKRPKVAFDPTLWQWRDEGGFIHIKTGETREENEFLDPDAKSGATRDESDWDAPQDGGGDDW